MSGPRPPAERGADLLLGAYLDYRADLAALTRAAAGHFARRDWAAAHDDAVERLAVYRRRLDAAIAGLGDLFGDALRRKPAWRELKAAFRPRAGELIDGELAETFFNSATRRVFSTDGIDPEIEFVSPTASLPEASAGAEECDHFPCAAGLEALLRDLLDRHRPGCGWEDLERDVALGAEAIRRAFPGREISGAELVRSPFFRGQGAYLVGRLLGPGLHQPLLLALTNPGGSVRLDAVLTAEDEVSIVFSFTRSYFFVEARRPAALVRFLKAIMPRKPVAELYNSLGFNKHGKTEHYRALLHHLESTDARFVIARGERGMVMVVFELEGFDSVFKIIRDRFEYPKSTTRAEVMGKYRLVFEHDRAGRLVDAQEFEHLVFARERFAPDLLDELAAKTSGTVRIEADAVHFDHLYTERRLVPLDVYLREAPPEAAGAAVLDFGQTLRDLAATDIFPGDLLLKNFGVTRHHRVVFYDYDELCRVTDCSFRDLPTPATDEEETAGEAWFYVDEKDIFPEEFIRFFGIPAPLRETFLAAHRDLLRASFWRALQEDHRRGVYHDVLPYAESRRLHRG
ncbi:MAG: bifunctional isocitrate dehydrogenase kinase/phosphatase [Thermoanaerobaculia bacterium]|nr:bifunctional isocitrate dehydrogenase kinase/phosphatase [Thermoanaerobaculia bacterium]MCZ7650434.1 bifunctional isocitrate dehydrogenase kinase/phosphatase [Thermoanaerobaculia bacterium]